MDDVRDVRAVLGCKLDEGFGVFALWITEGGYEAISVCFGEEMEEGICVDRIYQSASSHTPKHGAGRSLGGI